LHSRREPRCRRRARDADFTLAPHQRSTLIADSGTVGIVAGNLLGSAVIASIAR
jgi:hypothetical protein